MEESSHVFLVTQRGLLIQVVQTDANSIRAFHRKWPEDANLGPSHRRGRFPEVSLSGIRKERSQLMPRQDCIPDVEFYGHLSLPNIHRMIEKFGHGQGQGGRCDLSEFFDAFLSRDSISNLVQVLDIRIRADISSLCLAQGSPESS
jgi:hypothetical protein